MLKIKLNNKGRITLNFFKLFFTVFNFLVSENIFLQRFLKVSGNDEEKALDLLVANLKFRQMAPHIFENRDVESDAIQNACHKGM